ncbi:MAG: clan AA aspartic protease [Pirellulales bacterium]
MGLVTAPITLRNPLDDRLAPYEAKALVDTGGLLLCIPEHVATQLQLQEIQTRDITTADGKRHLCPYVGPVEIVFKNRICFQGALVLGDDVLLGAVPMQDLDVIIVPSRETIDVNPESPNLPMAIVK